MATLYTKEQKKDFYKNMREQWQRAKELAEDENYKNKYSLLISQSPSLSVSMYSFAFTLAEMEKLKLQGLPYLDTKTFKGWIDSGFKVKKGEKSKINGITWIKKERKDDKDKKDDSFCFPKTYKLFHRSQVEKNI